MKTFTAHMNKIELAGIHLASVVDRYSYKGYECSVHEISRGSYKYMIQQKLFQKTFTSVSDARAASYDTIDNHQGGKFSGLAYGPITKVLYKGVTIEIEPNPLGFSVLEPSTSLHFHSKEEALKWAKEFIDNHEE